MSGFKRGDLVTYANVESSTVLTVCKVQGDHLEFEENDGADLAIHYRKLESIS